MHMPKAQPRLCKFVRCWTSQQTRLRWCVGQRWHLEMVLCESFNFFNDFRDRNLINSIQGCQWALLEAVCKHWGIRYNCHREVHINLHEYVADFRKKSIVTNLPTKQNCFLSISVFRHEKCIERLNNCFCTKSWWLQCWYVSFELVN